MHTNYSSDHKKAKNQLNFFHLLVDKFTGMFFILVLGLVLSFSIGLFLKVSKLHIGSFNCVSFPPMEEIVQNLQLLFFHADGGYIRTISGYLIFLLISLFFLSSGSMILNMLFRIKDSQTNALLDITTTEKISLSYILGSLAASLIWFALGLIGWLTIYSAIIVAAIGIVMLFIQMVKNRSSLANLKITFINSLRTAYASYTVTEKILFLLIIFLLFLFSTAAVIPPQQGDTLYAHAALPNYYISWGKLLINPYHFYTYFTQNTEMLVIWTLLFRSEVAATLLIWGFLFSFVLLMWGFFRRYTSNLAAFVTIIIFLSVPLVGQSVITIKADLPMALFIFSHYYALIEALNKRQSSYSESKRWVLLSGILCGGAIGHKLNALPIAFCSFFLILISDLYYKKILKSGGLLIPFWLIGVIATVTPWFLRTYIETGNPIYPFFGKIFGSDLSDPFHANIKNNFDTDRSVLIGMKSIFHRLLFGQTEVNFPDWGPTLFLCLLSLLFFRSSYPIGFRLTIVPAIVSIFLLFDWTAEVRYYIGLLTFVIPVSFVLTWNILLKIKGRFGKILKFSTLIIIVFCFSQVFSNLWFILLSSLNIMISGNTPGNYQLMEKYTNNMRWISHIINTRTDTNDIILCAGIERAYGINRKIIFSSGFNREPICELAKKSANADMLKNELRNLDVSHILLNSSFYDYFKNHSVPELRMQENDLNKIKELLGKFMVLRFSSPDDQILWYTFNDHKYDPIQLNQNDAKEFPYMYIDEAQTQHSLGNLAISRNLLEKASNTPMSLYNKLRLYDLLINIYETTGETFKLEKTLIDTTKIEPQKAEFHFALALFYENKGDFDKASNIYKKIIELNADYEDAYLNLGNIYYRKNDYTQALNFYQQLTNLNPKRFDVYNNLGKVYYQLGDHPKALEMYQKVIDLNPAYDQTYMSVGYIYFQQKDYDKATTFFQKAIEINPKNIEAYKNLIYIYNLQKESGKVNELYQAMQKVSP